MVSNVKINMSLKLRPPLNMAKKNAIIKQPLEPTLMEEVLPSSSSLLLPSFSSAASVDSSLIEVENQVNVKLLKKTPPSTHSTTTSTPLLSTKRPLD